jgi:hypothetical protein
MSSTVHATDFEEEAVFRCDKLEMELKVFCKKTRHTTQWTFFSGGHVMYPDFQTFKLARKTLPVPATSIASERVFSRSGQVVSDRRNRLKPEHTEMLVCLSLNLK